MDREPRQECEWKSVFAKKGGQREYDQEKQNMRGENYAKQSANTIRSRIKFAQIDAAGERNFLPRMLLKKSAAAIGVFIDGCRNSLSQIHRMNGTSTERMP